MATVEVMARANLTLQGRLLTVYEVATLDDTDEVKACIANDYLVERGPDGAFPDLGPIGSRISTPGIQCCGQKSFR